MLGSIASILCSVTRIAYSKAVGIFLTVKFAVLEWNLSRQVV